MSETNVTDLGTPDRRAVITLLWKRAPKLGLSWVDTCALADELLTAADTGGQLRAARAEAQELKDRIAGALV